MAVYLMFLYYCVLFITVTTEALDLCSSSTGFLPGEYPSIAASKQRITFSLNVGYSDGCENDMSPQRALQPTSDASSIRPVTHIPVCKGFSCVCVHFMIALYPVGNSRQRTKAQGAQPGRSRWMWLVSHTEVWHHVNTIAGTNSYSLIIDCMML